MKGRRLPAPEHIRGGTFPVQPGDYYQAETGWMGMTPNGHVADLRNHTVTEHDDGTITVSPSILVSSPHNGKSGELWHGFLERGVWRSA